MAIDEKDHSDEIVPGTCLRYVGPELLMPHTDGGNCRWLSRGNVFFVEQVGPSFRGIPGFSISMLTGEVLGPHNFWPTDVQVMSAHEVALVRRAHAIKGAEDVEGQRHAAPRRNED